MDKIKYLIDRNFFGMLIFFVATFMINLTTHADTEALKNYIEKQDDSFQWEVRGKIPSDKVTLYDVLLTSQEWKTGRWMHQLRIVVPDNRNESNTALLYITGGRNEGELPKWKDPNQEELQLLAQIATASGAPIAVLNQVPNQPHYSDRFEDDLISYTFLKYLETKDKEWPLLFPMAKSAVRAMDAIEQFGDEIIDWEINTFVVSGGSKRGWTTWLTGAHDDRVIGIAPMVIDVLNMRDQMQYQLDAWGKYSEQIQDYETKEFEGTNLLEIVRNGDQGKDLLEMVDPYSYIKNLTIPKMIFIGTNDPYWPADAIKLYYDELQGKNNFIHYVPNAGHGLGDGKQAITALAAFFGYFVKNGDHPSLTWTVEDKDGMVNITAKAGDGFQQGHVWVATSEDRDFRDSEFASFPGQVEGNTLKGMMPYPRKGYVAIYLDAEFNSPLNGKYTKSTQLYIVTPDGLLLK